MISPKVNLLVFIFVFFVTKSFSQQPAHYNIYSGFGIGGGATQLNIFTDNFNITPQVGWLFKASTTVEIPHKWYNVSYGMQIFQNKLDIEGRLSNLNTKPLAINYKLTGAQLAFLWHAKLIESYVTFDFGPMLQYNGVLELEDKDQESYLVSNFTKVTAKDIKNISNLQVIPAVGITAGISYFKFTAQYLFSISNMLGKLNKKDLDLDGNEVDFKGHQGMIALSAMFTFH